MTTKETGKTVITENKEAIKGSVPLGTIEVTVEGNNVDRAIKSLKRRLIREGMYKLLKQKKYFEKPSERKKRKKKEAIKKIRKDEARAKKSLV